LSASERDEAERAVWCTRAEAEFKAETLVFVDESGCNVVLTPLYTGLTRAFFGKRVA
jgi:hypothetical protein